MWDIALSILNKLIWAGLSFVCGWLATRYKKQKATKKLVSLNNRGVRFIKYFYLLLFFLYDIMFMNSN